MRAAKRSIFQIDSAIAKKKQYDKNEKHFPLPHIIKHFGYSQQ
jgi:hypothetical protein